MYHERPDYRVDLRTVCPFKGAMGKGVFTGVRP
jgi:hypothetical protein